MKKNSLLISFVIVLGLIKTLAAQPKLNDSTAVYQYWAKRGIIEMVYAHMNDYIEAVGDVRAKNEVLGKDKYEKEFISDIDKQEHLDLDTVSSFLVSNSWKGIAKTLFQPLIKNLTDTLPLNIQFFLDTKRNISKIKGKSNLVPIDYISGPGEYNDINKRAFWKNKGEEIIDNYEKDLANLSKIELKPPEVEDVQLIPLVEEQREPQNQLYKSNRNWTQSLISPMLFLSGLLIGGWLVFFISKRKIYSILDKEKRKYLHDLKMTDKSFVFKYIGLFHLLKKSKDDKKDKIEKLNEKYESIFHQEKITRLQNDNLKSAQLNSPTNTIEKQEPDQIEAPTALEKELRSPEKIKLKLFFSMPESDGRFIINNGDTSNDGRKYYKIEYHESSEEGELYFISSERDKRAINRLESYLKPVCDIENITNAESSTHIDFIIPGKVNLINDSWVIDSDKKVKIKLL